VRIQGIQQVKKSKRRELILKEEMKRDDERNIYLKERKKKLNERIKTVISETR